MARQDQEVAFESDPASGPEPPVPRFAVGTREVAPLLARPTADIDLERALTLAGEPAFAIDRRGHILEVNERAAELTGIVRELLIGQPLSTAIATTHGDAIASYVGTHVRFLPGAAEVRITRGGESEPADVLVSPYDAQTLLVVVRPSTRTVPTLHEDDVAVIAHDLMRPLSMIALEAELLDRRLEADEAVDVQSSTERVLRNVRYFGRMVHDLIDVCSLHGGMLWLHRQQTELCALVRGVVDRMSSATERMRVFIEAPTSVVLALDEVRIERVIANFLTNALKYAPDVSGIVVRVDAMATCARVSVTDAGPGMTAPEMSYIFDKYRRTRGARGCEGSGLGLYISKQIIDAHGGMIGVDSLHGVGCHFFFELPR